MESKARKHPKGLVRRFLPYFKKYKAVLFFDLFCAALTTVCELVLPMLVRYVTNAGINDLASLTVGVVLKIGALYLFLRLVDAAANFFMASIGHIMGTKIETDMRTAMFDHLQKLSFNYFDNTKVGQIMTRITTARRSFSSRASKSLAPSSFCAGSMCGSPSLCSPLYPSSSSRPSISTGR